MKAHLDPVAWKRKVRIRRIILIALAVLLTAAGVTLFLLRNRIIPAIRYSAAEGKADRGRITEAIDGFALLGTYRDANARASALAYGLQQDDTLKKEFRNASPGDIVEFGRYEQDNNAANGAEPIRWIVLAKQDGRFLLWSEKVLDGKPYHDTKEDVTWETSSLRKWLNGTFLNTAFTNEEQALIALTVLKNKANPAVGTPGGKDTKDRAAILSFDELILYGLHASFLEGIWAEPTDYAVAQGVERHQWYGTAMWWMRTPGQEPSHVVYCDMGGQPLYNAPATREHFGIRPIIWVFIPNAD